MPRDMLEAPIESTTTTQLRQARDLIDKGHCTGTLARTTRGEEVDPRNLRAAQFCIYGALSRVMDAGVEIGSPERRVAESAAERYLKDACRSRFVDAALCIFNNTRSKAEVLALYDDAIARSLTN